MFFYILVLLNVALTGTLSYFRQTLLVYFSLLIENFYKFVAYGAGQQQTTVVLTQPQNVLLRQTFREISVRLNCPKCNADIMTATTYEVGMLTWLACGGMCLVG